MTLPLNVEVRILIITKTVDQFPKIMTTYCYRESARYNQKGAESEGAK